MFQPNDTSDSHSTNKTFVSHQTGVLLQGEDEQLQPSYIPAVEKILREYGMELSSVRTFVKFLTNEENWLKDSFTNKAVRKGYRLSGLIPWSLRRFLERYSGFQWLTQEDLDHISHNFFQLVLMAIRSGVVHDYDIREILTDDWCRGISIKSTSVGQRYANALASLQSIKPIEQRNILQYPCTWLTNKAMREKLLAQAMEKVIKIMKENSDAIEKENEKILKKEKDEEDAIAILNKFAFDDIEEFDVNIIDTLKLKELQILFRTMVSDIAQKEFRKNNNNNKVAYVNILKPLVVKYFESDIDTGTQLLNEDSVGNAVQPLQQFENEPQSKVQHSVHAQIIINAVRNIDPQLLNEDSVDNAVQLLQQIENEPQSKVQHLVHAQKIINAVRDIDPQLLNEDSVDNAVQPLQQRAKKRRRESM